MTWTYLVYMPKEYDSKTPMPLIVHHHGWGLTAKAEEKGAGIAALADKLGVIVVTPQGMGDNTHAGGPWYSWNAVGSTQSPGPGGDTCTSKANHGSYCYTSCGKTGGELESNLSSKTNSSSKTYSYTYSYEGTSACTDSPQCWWTTCDETVTPTGTGTDPAGFIPGTRIRRPNHQRRSAVPRLTCPHRLSSVRVSPALVYRVPAQLSLVEPPCRPCSSPPHGSPFADARAGLYDTLETQLCIDVSREYASGESNGGMQTYQLGVDLSKRLAAILPEFGSFHHGFAMAPAHGMPVLDLHGTHDTTVPANESLSADGYFYTPTHEIFDGGKFSTGWKKVRRSV